jgi:hypothetical protein
MNYRGNDVIRTLPEVDVIIRMNIEAGTQRGNPGQDLVGVHVAARPRTGLENVYRELVKMMAVGHFTCRIANRACHAFVQ